MVKPEEQDNPATSVGKQLEQSIAALEAQRAVLGDAIVSPAITALRKQLAELQAARPAPGEQKLAERKLVTILFGDLAGFTSLSEQLDPEAVRRLMNACFDALQEVIDRYGGHVDKYIGDRLMVLSGAPVAYEDHAERAQRAALAIRARLAAFNAHLADDPLLTHLPLALCALDIHIGVNTGLVIAGGLGAHDSQQYTVMGDAVNVASRLTDLSAPGQILVGEATYQLIAPLFELALLPPMSLRGKQERQQVYELQGFKSQPERLRGLERLGLRAPLVGRGPQVARLREILAQLQNGLGCVVSIIGEAGVGKSRLVAEIRGGGGAPPLQWVEGRCLSYGEMLSYHPFWGLLRALLRAAGYADGAALPPLRYAATSGGGDTLGQALISHWQEVLGIRFVMEQWTLAEIVDQIDTHPPHLFDMTWIADYPDPHNFVAQGFTQREIWRSAAYWAKVGEAARTLDVRKRMALYHELDRQLVVEEALCIPLSYGRVTLILQPRVRFFHLWPIACDSFKDVVMEES